MPRHKGEYMNLAATSFNHWRLFQIFRLIIGSLNMYVRLHQGEKLYRGRLIEDGDVVDTPKAQQDLGTVLGTVNGTIGSFEPAHRSITIDTNQEKVSKLPRLFQNSHMTDMENIETTVGGNYLLTDLAHLSRELFEFSTFKKSFYIRHLPNPVFE